MTKKETLKWVVQLVASIATAILTALGATSCMGGLNIRGQPEDTRTEAQKVSMRRLLEELHLRYPRAIIIGHHDLNPLKDCPCIKDVVHEYADLQPK